MLALGVALLLAGSPTTRGQQDEMLEEMLKQAPAASRPAEVTPPPPMALRPVAGGSKETGVAATTNAAVEAPRRARAATLTLNGGKKISGLAWTTRDSPLRVYQDASKTYRDVDLALVQKLEVVVDEATLEDDWRWLKEGSDQKVYSGKKYPNLVLHYKITLHNGQVIEGPVVAPIFITQGAEVGSYALYKKRKGELGQSLKELVYVQELSFSGGPIGQESGETLESRGTTHLPLIED